LSATERVKEEKRLQCEGDGERKGKITMELTNKRDRKEV
jgi:hypothetical protein